MQRRDDPNSLCNVLHAPTEESVNFSISYHSSNYGPLALSGANTAASYSGFMCKCRPNPRMALKRSRR